MMDNRRLTRKQVAILDVIMRGAEDGGLIDMDTLLEKLPYETTKDSMQFSIRYLIRRGLVEKRPRELRRGRRRITYALTVEALKSYDARSGEFDIIEEGLDDYL